MKMYYKTKTAIVRETKQEDIDQLADNLRASDITEIWNSHHKTPRDALSDGFNNSIVCLTIECNQKSVGMFGIVPMSFLGNTATIWFLGSPEIKGIEREFIRYSKTFIKIMLEHYSHLINYIDAGNKQTIKWLKMCGAKVGPDMPYGVEKLPFRYFEFRRRDR